ncbi:hypothetical protein I316_00137 [Kwoniella heveanensis BCC8398]|uniref:NAD-dependent epimerase/dehydratase domain-containing protein n=1 Tax=Kwoniella heveanensis BCC8398 TaxID=1296120 RepID=A0A1B9H3R2_9TREE|nr:hypothetical protein I316_00137 [Kwoniella heveanensis BCC8398]
MTVISKGDTFWITGASGFIAAHLALALLTAGYKVKGTVSSEAKGEYFVKLFKQRHGLEGFEYVIVGDITEDGAFDLAVKGVDVVAHLAPPFYMTGINDPQELIDPAVKGTTGILKSNQKNK